MASLEPSSEAGLAPEAKAPASPSAFPKRLFVWEDGEPNSEANAAPQKARSRRPTPDSGETGEGESAADIMSRTMTGPRTDSLPLVAWTETFRNRIMKSRIDKSLLLAVRLEDALEKFGAQWYGEISGGLTLKAKTNGQEFAREVDEIDDFISHDWGTAGWQKYIALCFMYNGEAAAVVGISISTILGLLQIWYPDMRRMLGGGYNIAGQRYQVEWTGYFGLASSILVPLLWMNFGQRIRRLVSCTSRMVFVDKLCIHQTDPYLKAAGILGLTGFLRESQNLVVLWSPRYFSRLWCVYEVASWMHLEKETSKVHFFPLALALFGITVMFALFFSSFLLMWAARWTDVEYNLAAVVITLTSLAAPTHIIRRLIRDLQRMPRQVAAFSLKRAECFCCSNNHKIPGTDVDIPCDRELIEGQLALWGQATGEEDPLEKFDLYVREQLGSHILTKVGGSRIPYKMALMISVPVWGFNCDRLVLVSMVEPWGAMRLMLHYVTTYVAVFPTAIRVALLAAVFLDRTLGVRERLLEDLLVTVLGICMFAGYFLGCLALLVYALQPVSVVPQIIITVLVWAFTVLLYSEQGVRCLNRFESIGSKAVLEEEAVRISAESNLDYSVESVSEAAQIYAATRQQKEQKRLVAEQRRRPAAALPDVGGTSDVEEGSCRKHPLQVPPQLHEVRTSQSLESQSSTDAGGELETARIRHR